MKGGAISLAIARRQSDAAAQRIALQFEISSTPRSRFSMSHDCVFCDETDLGFHTSRFDDPQKEVIGRAEVAALFKHAARNELIYCEPNRYAVLISECELQRLIVDANAPITLALVLDGNVNSSLVVGMLFSLDVRRKFGARPQSDLCSGNLEAAE